MQFTALKYILHAFSINLGIHRTALVWTVIYGDI